MNRLRKKLAVPFVTAETADTKNPAMLPASSPTFDAVNVRAYDVMEDRARGGQRPALDKWGDGDQIGSIEQPVVAMCVIGAVR